MNGKSEDAESGYRLLEERYRQLFQQHPSGYHSLDAEGNIIEVNQAWLDNLGYTREEVIGCWIGDFLTSEGVEKFRRNFQQFKELGIVRTDFWVKHKDGSLRYEIIDGRIAYDWDGTFKQTHCVLTDNTENKRLEERVAASEAQFRFVLDNLPSAVSIVQNGKIVFGNSRIVTLTGYSLEELADMDVFTLIHPDEREGIIDRYRRRQLGEKLPQAYSLRVIKKDGSIVWVRRRVVSLNWQGRPALLVMDVDITARMKTEEESRRNREKLDLMLGQMPCILWSMDHDLRYTSASGLGLKVSGRVPGDLVGKTIFEYSSKYSEDSPFVRALRRALAGESVTVEETSVLNERTFLISMEPMRGNEGEEVIGVVGVSLDITERKAAELRQAEVTRELEKRNAFIQSVLDNLPLGVALNRIGDGQATYMNPQFENIYGWSREEITDIGTFFEKVYPDPEYRTSIISRVMADIESGDASRMHWDNIEITRKDGEKRVIAAANIPIPEQDIMVSTVRDVTEIGNARKELRHTLDLMRYVIEHDQAGIAVHDKDLNYIYVSQRYLDEYNISEKDIIGRHHYDVFPDLPQKWRDIHQRVLAGEVCRGDMDEYVRADGNREWTRWESRPWYQADGTVGGLIVYTEVITDRVRQEIANKESEEKYRQLAENTESISWEYDIIKDRWTYMAPQVKRILGYRPDEFTDFQFWVDQIHKEDREWASKYCLTATASGRNHSLEYRFLKKNGGVVWLRDIVSVEKEKNKPVKLRGIMIDITERKQAEDQALHAASEWLATFDSITDMVALVDAKHRITRVNQAFARTLGRKPGELLGKHCYQVLHGLTGPHPECPHARTLVTKQVESSEYYDDKLGLWVEATASPILDKTGKMTGSVHIIKDISSRKQAEDNERLLREKAEMSSRLAAVGEMAAGIAHEINNPLTGVIGFSELLTARQDVPDDIKSDLRIINDGSQRVKEIVRRMLTFARQNKPMKSTVNIIDVLENTIEMRRYVLETSNISVVKDYKADIPDIIADGGQLQQVFLNLIVNAEYAIKEADIPGILVFKAEQPDGFIRVSVTDNGTGMPPETLNKLFQPFFTTKDPGKGTGLGLSLSRGIIEEHGGTITVDSVPGQGTTFVIELPVVIDNTSPPVEITPVTTMKKNTSYRILVIDDEPGVGKFAETVFRQAGHAAVVETDTESALRRIAEENFDAVFTDIRMPGMSGIELYNEIAARWPRLVNRVVFITGDTSDEHVRQYLATHKILYLVKPFSQLELLEKLDQVTILA